MGKMKKYNVGLICREDLISMNREMLLENSF